jgi:hypothetical protein
MSPKTVTKARKVFNCDEALIKVQQMGIELDDELESCPFCNGTHVSITYGTNPEREVTVFFGECTGCAAMGPTVDANYDDLETWIHAAAAKWNERP